jgi:hypothetical protein
LEKIITRHFVLHQTWRILAHFLCRKSDTLSPKKGVLAFRGESAVQTKTELWMRLCEMAAKEHDSQKLVRLVALINRLLERKEARLKSKQQPKSNAA